MANPIQRIRVKAMRYRRLRWPRHVRKARLMSRHPFAVPVITITILLILSAGLYILARETNHLPPVQQDKIVIVSHDGVKQIVPSKEPTVGALLTKLHITLGQGDVVEPALTTPIDQDEFRINIYRAVPVEIVDGSNKTFTFSAATTPRAIAQQAGVNLYPQDIASTLPNNNFLSGEAIGEQVVINRATPVNVDLYGTQVVLRTHARTVAGLIKEEGIKLTSNIQVEPGLNTPIAGLNELNLILTGTKTVTEPVTIPMPVQTIEDNSLAYGTSAIRQQGSPGQEDVTYKVSEVDNVVTSQVALQTVVIKPAVTQIEVIGTSLSGIKGDMALAGISPTDYQYADYIISHESGWCPTKAQGEYGDCPVYTGYVPDYGGYGLCQSTPGIKMASAGADWATNPITQLDWCNGYAQSHYGGWYNAYEHWLNYHNW